MIGHVLATLKLGIPFILSGPTGTGKTTLAEKLQSEFSSVVVSISYTTRAPRDGEIDGQHYFFVSEAEFERRIAEGDFLEYVQLYNCYYGTSAEWVRKQREGGKHVFLVIDTQGARLIRTSLPCVSIFVAPPSLEELKRRLALRSTESPEVIQRRLEWDKKEIAASSEYDYVVVNDDFDTAFDVLRSIVIAETHSNAWHRPVKDSIP